MSEEQFKAFLEQVKGDGILQEKLKAAKTPEEVAGIAKAAGFSILADSLKKTESEFSKEISLQELEGVAGGTLTNCNARDTWSTPPGGGLPDVIGSEVKNLRNSRKIKGMNERTRFDNLKRDLDLF